MKSAHPNKSLPRLVKDARVAKGYTQQQLADLIKVNLRSIQRVENGEVVPRSYTLELLAKELDIKLERTNSSQILSPDSVREPRTKALKLIITLSTGLLFILLTAAFLSQASKFPETTFELFLMLAIEVAVYGMILWRIWK